MSDPILRTKSDVLKLSNEDLKKKIRTPEGLAEVNRALNATEETPVLTPEEEALQAQATQEAADAAAAQAAAVEAAQQAPPPPAPVVVDDSARRAEAEAAAYKAAGLTIEKDSSGNITRIIKEYQAKDEQHNPIGRPTHLEATSWLDLSIKEQIAHENATRAFHRLKSQKVSFKNPQPAEPVNKELTDDEMLKALEDLKGDDPTKAIVAARKIAGSEVASANEKARMAEAKADGQRIGYEFMKRHITDFNPCQANSDVLGKYLEDNALEFTLDNLELALLAVESQLAPVQVQVPVAAAPSVDNPTAPESTAASAASAAPAASVPAAAAAQAAIAPPATPAPTALPAVPANPEPPAARPGVNGGIQPGTLSSRPTVVVTSKLTKADILKMDKEKLRRIVKDPNKRAEINAILASSATSA